MTESRNPLEQALDLVVFAPIGLAITVVEDLPELAQKGRERVQRRAATAKVVGQFAVAEGRRRLAAQTERPASSAAPARGASRSSTQGRPSPPAPPTRTRSAGATRQGTGSPVPASNELGIPGYDSLSASQVVQRLASLSGPELDAVQAYETATRGRRTVLSRISQLQQD